MREKLTVKQFVEKCVWEGGSLLEGLDYGLSYNDIEDEYFDPDFKNLVKEAEIHFLKYKEVEDKIFNKFSSFDEIFEIKKED